MNAEYRPAASLRSNEPALPILRLRDGAGRALLSLPASRTKRTSNGSTAPVSARNLARLRDGCEKSRPTCIGARPPRLLLTSFAGERNQVYFVALVEAANQVRGYQAKPS